MDERFWLLDFDAADHQDDLREAVRTGKLIAVVDEDAGGIIGYALGDENAWLILDALRERAR